MQRKLSHLVLEWIEDALLPYSGKRCIRKAPKDCMSQVCRSQRKVSSYVLDAGYLQRSEEQNIRAYS